VNAQPQWLISVDDHLIEKPTLWTERLPARYRDIGPRIEAVDGVERWMYEDVAIPTVGLMSVVGRSREDWTPTPVNYSDIHPGSYDSTARVADMDIAGILAQANFPSFPRFCGQIFLEATDKDLALLCVQAWNDHMAEEWRQAHPGRFLHLAMVPLWDPHLAAAEARRCIENGAHGILFSENVSVLGQPSIHDAGGYWDPLWEVVNETGKPLCCHVGSSSKLESTSRTARRSSPCR